MFILFRLLAIIMVLIAIAYKATTTTAKNTQKLKQKNRLSCSNIWQRGKSFFSFMLILSVTHLCIHLLRRIFEALQTCLPVVTRSNHTSDWLLKCQGQNEATRLPQNMDSQRHGRDKGLWLDLGVELGDVEIVVSRELLELSGCVGEVIVSRWLEFEL